MDARDVDPSFIAHLTALLMDLLAPKIEEKEKARAVLLPQAKVRAKDVARLGKARIARASLDQKM
eukprot:8672380-Pyramimonas_sp.AAC.1